ncbi:MAG: zinc protease [Planctomycetota bacterium]|jgi:zinc protease
MRQMILNRLLLAASLAVTLTCTSSGFQSSSSDQGALTPRAWAHEDSDIPVNPRYHFGHLENGIRWVWATNAIPKDRSYLRLHVNVGSLAESEDERGMAHFLEHMAFNGSRNFAPGTLVEWFQERGMTFGADANAHTNFSETVYKIDLPNSGEEQLREGLTVLRDFADGLLIQESEVEAEKGVINGEERERASASQRVADQRLNLVFKNTLVSKRLPIGLEATRDKFTADSVRAFYEKWYRPENMTVVLLGDIGELDPAALIEDLFADMPVPEVALPREPSRGKLARFDQSFSIYEAEIPTVTLLIQRSRPWVAKDPTVANTLKDLSLDYARSMLSLRLANRSKSKDAPYLNAGASRHTAFRLVDGDGLSIVCNPERWKEALFAGESELRRAIEFGFQQHELDEMRANTLRRLDERYERRSTAGTRGMLKNLMNAVESPTVPTDQETRRDMLRPAIEALTVEGCQAALSAAWSMGELSINTAGNLDLGTGAAQQLLAAYKASRLVSVEPKKLAKELAFAYSSDDTDPGKVVSRKDVEDLGFTMVRFANGVALNIKRTEERKKAILTSMMVGEGQLTLDPEKSAVAWVASRVFSSFGLAAHSADDLRRLMAGKRVGINFSIAPDQFHFGGQTTTEDLLLQCELMCAFLASPGWRNAGLEELRRQLPLIYEGISHSPQGPLGQEFRPALFGGDPRFGTPSEEQAAAVKMRDIRKWLDPSLRSAALEISLIGDLDIDEAIAIAARTFGKLPERQTWRALDERRIAPTPVAGMRQTHEIETEVPKSFVLLAFPIPDGMESNLRRGFNVLTGIVNDRLRLEIRERLGYSYSPRARVDQSRTYPGVGMLYMQAMAAPEEVDDLVAACLRIAESLAKEGVTEEEVERLRNPMLTGMRDAKLSNKYWAGILGRPQRDPSQVDQARTAEEFLESFNKGDLDPLAAEYLKAERASILVVNPNE